MAKRTSNNLRLRSVKPSAGLRDAYAKKLKSLVNRMAQDVASRIQKLYQTEEPLIAVDAKAEKKLPAKKLQKMLDDLRKKWEVEVFDFAEPTANWFVTKASGYVDRAQNAAIKDAGIPGFDIRFEKGTLSKDAFEALVSQNVSLIKSIGTKYLDDVEGSVMRAVTAGRDVASLKEELSTRYGMTRRRAEFIARDQCNKAIEGLARANDLETGVEEGVWIHVPGKKTSRESHRAMDGKKFDLSKGMYDREVGRYVMPGELPGCQCSYQPVLSKKIWKKLS